MTARYPNVGYWRTTVPMDFCGSIKNELFKEQLNNLLLLEHTPFTNQKQMPSNPYTPLPTEPAVTPCSLTLSPPPYSSGRSLLKCQFSHVNT